MAKDSIVVFNELTEIGDTFFSRNEYFAARSCFNNALTLDPSKSDLFFKVGYCAMQSSDYEFAKYYFHIALLIDPNHEKSYLNLGYLHNILGKSENAILYFLITSTINPSNFHCHYNLGIVYFSLKNYELSKLHLKIAATINPFAHEVAYNLGVLSNQLGSHFDAVNHYLDSIAIEPSQIMTWFNIGVSYFELSIPQKAIDSYQKVLFMDPEHIQSNWNLSHCLLLVDDYKNGFSHYEWRWKQNENYYQQVQRSFASELWLGQTSLENKSILIYAEQGFGDTLQFIRFCNHSVFKFATLVVEVQPELVTLIQSSFPSLKVISKGEEMAQFDFHTPLMSLPLALGIQHPRSIDSQNYIHPNSKIVDAWKHKVLNYPNPRLGLVWSSGYRKDQEETWEANKRRNLQLLNLRFLNEFDFSFFTIQKGFVPQSELTALENENWGGPRLIDFTHHLFDFEQTAALIFHLDYIVTVDTSVAHLAGAMGKPTFLLLKFNADWRWHYKEQMSTWYPNTQIFRQSKPFDWSAPLEQLRAQLQKLIVTTNYC